VGVWVGYNGNSLRLDGPGAGSCVQGVGTSQFGQVAFCNAQPFFAAANSAISAGKLKVPALGTARDGKPCPTVRDFSVVDQDQSDNTPVDYLVGAEGTIAQDTPRNRAALPRATSVGNGSDEGLLSRRVDAALGCTPWTAPDLADATHAQRLPALPLNELQAAANQAAPVALVPANDPFVLVDGSPNLAKLNAYRAGVDQPAAASLPAADTGAYCRNLLQTGVARVIQDSSLTMAAPSPFPAMANNLYNFLGLRLSGTWDLLGCAERIRVANPVKLQTKGDLVVGAQIVLNPGGPQATPPPSGVGTPAPAGDGQKNGGQTNVERDMP
jgi:hypothetical protein